ncbi:MAG: hypothetical protein ACKN9U_12700, partial [Pirellulaceae bacterium]
MSWDDSPLWAENPFPGAHADRPDRKNMGVKESWESSVTGRLAEGPWQIQQGRWGEIGQQDADGAGRKYRIEAGQISQIKRPVDFGSVDHIVLQGWFQDPGEPTSSTLGLASENLDRPATIVRMGTTGKKTYSIEFFRDADGVSGIRELDTQVE